MKIVFVSNYYSHHQKEVSETLFSLTSGEYRFIETAYMEKERTELGWGGNDKPSYVLNIQESPELNDICVNYINNADVIITGSAPEYLFRKAIKHHKLIFRYAERPFKDRYIYDLGYPIRFLRYHLSTLARSNVYMLCASAFTAADYNKYALFRNKVIKWGYFPETRIYPNIDKVINDKKKKSILWCGRFLDWKHPDDAIKVAKQLKEEELDFTLNMIGIGPMLEEIESMINEYNLNDCVTLLGAMKPTQVRTLMEESEIVLFTSDFQEGWGAVLNEAMNSACAVVASHAAGSTPFLISYGENGYIYKSGDIGELTLITKTLLNDMQLSHRLGKRAYETITNMWNAKNATERLYSTCEKIVNGDKELQFYPEGPCSKAPILEDNWFDVYERNIHEK